MLTRKRSGKVRFRLDFEKGVLISNMERRKWTRTNSDRDWNFFWASVGTIRQIYNPEVGYRLSDDQILNHFPNFGELTRKDLMIKNIKQYRKKLEKEGSVLGQRDKNTGEYTYMELAPSTYILPGDYSLFVEDFKRNGGMWIMKPCAKAQGKGIFIVNKLSQLKKWAANRWPNGNSRESYVISRYVDHPFLVGGKKFDLRLYVLVTSYRPLRCYLYKEGFARFCNKKYSNDDLDNHYMHLTNVAINKHGDDYNEKHGNKWSLKHLRLYMEGTCGYVRTQRCFDDIAFIIIHSLKSCQNVMIQDRHCFECYGYDIILDEQLKPWLIEINASPSLSASTKPDRIMKAKLINDVLRVVIPPDFPDLRTSNGYTGWNDTKEVGGFTLLYDDALPQHFSMQTKYSQGPSVGAPNPHSRSRSSNNNTQSKHDYLMEYTATDRKLGYPNCNAMAFPSDHPLHPHYKNFQHFREGGTRLSSGEHKTASESGGSTGHGGSSSSGAGRRPSTASRARPRSRRQSSVGGTSGGRKWR